MNESHRIVPRQFFVPRNRLASDPVARYQAVKKAIERHDSKPVRARGGSSVESR
jgi:hypothetical protein